MRIKPVQYDQSTPEVKREYDNQLRQHGRITNMKRTLLHSVPSFKALMEWYTLRDCVAKFLPDKSINYFCYAISSDNDCLICSTFFRKIIIESGDNPDNINFTEEEKLLIDFGKKCVTDSHNVDDEMYARLSSYYSDKQIVELTAFAGMMIATNLINNVLKVDLDEYLTPYTRR